MKLKIMVTWRRRNGKIVTLTNGSPETHTSLALSAYTAAMKRLGKKWNVTAEQAAEKRKRAVLLEEWFVRLLKEM